MVNVPEQSGINFCNSLQPLLNLRYHHSLERDELEERCQSATAAGGSCASGLNGFASGGWQ